MDSNKGSAQTSEDEVGHGVVEDEVGMRHEVARGGHVVDAPFHGECVPASVLHAADKGRALGGGLLGSQDGVKIVRPKVVADPAEDKYPKVALDPIPAAGQLVRAECEEPCATT